jgi:hypothetical protein
MWSRARKGEAPISPMTRDFVMSESCPRRWLNLADIEDGVLRGDEPGARRGAGAAQA